MKKIITCDLPLPIQKLYIKRLKHMIWRWEFENFCGHCPVQNKFEIGRCFVKKFYTWECTVCGFCQKNVGIYSGVCPCGELKPQEALKRAKDFIERFEAEDGGERC